MLGNGPSGSCVSASANILNFVKNPEPQKDQLVFCPVGTGESKGLGRDGPSTFYSMGFKRTRQK